MGLFKVKRPVFAPSFIVNTTDTTPTAGYVIGNFVQGVPVVASSLIQTITSSGISSSSTDATLTLIAAKTQIATIQTTGSGAGWEMVLTTGRTIGTSVKVSVANNTTASFVLLLESTTQTFAGSTFNALLWSTDSSGTVAELTKVSATQYIFTGDAAKVAPAGSTGTV